MALSNLGTNIFIGDSAATSHMTSNKLGVYNLLSINGSVLIGNGQRISCTHKGKLDVICKHKDESMAREAWDVKIVPQLNHDLFSFTKAMKEGWQMNGRWKEGGLVAELFKTTRTSMKFDRMIPSGSSWHGNQSSESVGPCTLCNGTRKDNLHVKTSSDHWTHRLTPIKANCKLYENQVNRKIGTM